MGSVNWMVVRSLSNLNLFKMKDENKNDEFYGCDQEWYTEEWQRKTGCGPTTVCNIFYYIKHTILSTELGEIQHSKEFGLLQMQEIWRYITPSESGIPTAKMFCESTSKYLKAKGLNVLCNSINIPKELQLRPDFRSVLNFIEDALIKDIPVAFLNLCNGAVSNLDKWHWVTIVEIEYFENCEEAHIKIIDEGLIKKIDLALWYNTTTLGGGFAFFIAQ